MNVRSRKPAANGASARAPATETSRSRYIAISSARYGTTDDATSSSVRASLGFAYGATAAFQGARAPPTTASSPAAPALIGPALVRSSSRRPTSATCRHRSDSWHDYYAESAGV